MKYAIAVLKLVLGIAIFLGSLAFTYSLLKLTMTQSDRISSFVWPLIISVYSFHSFFSGLDSLREKKTISTAFRWIGTVLGFGLTLSVLYATVHFYDMLLSLTLNVTLLVLLSLLSIYDLVILVKE